MTPLLRIACRIAIAVSVAILAELDPPHECHWQAWESEMADVDPETCDE